MERINNLFLYYIPTPYFIMHVKRIIKDLIKIKLLQTPDKNEENILVNFCERKKKLCDKHL